MTKTLRSLLQYPDEVSDFAIQIDRQIGFAVGVVELTSYAFRENIFLLHRNIRFPHRVLSKDVRGCERQAAEDDLAYVEFGACVVDIEADEAACLVVIDNNAV